MNVEKKISIHVSVELGVEVIKSEFEHGLQVGGSILVRPIMNRLWLYYSMELKTKRPLRLAMRFQTALFVNTTT